jgi:hypothetical protein
MSRTIFIAAALALAVTLPAAPARAADRTFVSASGNDSNPCTITLPCRGFQAAYMAVAANGQIDALDPGNYGQLTITGPVSIEGHGWASMSTVPGTASNTSASITINANTGDKISITGVVLDGFNTNFADGIRFNSGGSLFVRDSVIRNFNSDGIEFRPSASTSTLYVSNTLLSGNSLDGILVSTSGTASVTGTLDRVEIKNNGANGLIVNTSNLNINVTVSDSVIAGNNTGITGQSFNSGVAMVMVRNSTIANNTTGLDAEGPSCSGGAGGVLPSATIRITRSTITGNSSKAWSHSPTCGFVISYIDNNIDGNGDDTAPSNTLQYK